ncbi:MAG: hypothetical protein P8P74_07545 [Crocinitomicaceae bacterium]|nr:hypothetical protein [Crocinitomicaceae bacterium]
MRSYLITGLGIWIVLFALFLPFTYGFFPPLGIELTNSLSGISEWIAQSFFGVEIYSSPTTSDSTAQFAQAFLLLIFAFLLAILLRGQRRFTGNHIRQFLHTAAAYILSFFLLKYGVDKLFQFQFYTPEPNTLFTPLGMLSKDILFWSSMGTSSSYNTFMGLIEVIPAFLLLHHRTRLLGGLIALGVLGNVLMINFSFDITVKLLSMYLVIVSLYVLSPFLKNLFAFFIANTESTKPEMRLSLKPKVRTIIKSVVVIVLFTEILFNYVQMGSFNGREVEKIEHFGSYMITRGDNNPLNYKDIERIHIHCKGYLILENVDGIFIDFPIQIAPDNSIIVRNEGALIYVSREGPTTVFEIQKDGKSTSFITQKHELDSLPALDDSFHWTVDGMVGSSVSNEE